MEITLALSLTAQTAPIAAGRENHIDPSHQEFNNLHHSLIDNDCDDHI